MAESTARTLTLLNLLQSHRHWTGEELAERLGVTTRTLRRQVDSLRELGYEIESTRGVGGGYRLVAGNRMPPLLLTDDEAVTVAIGLRIAATTGLADAELTTLGALAKFEQVLPPSLRERVNALASAVEPQAPRADPVSPELLGQLALACRDRERVRFHYVAGDGAESDRRVEPHSLVSADRRWFLVAWDLEREDWRTFRVDRLSRLFGTRVRFEARPLPAEDATEFVAVTLGSVPTRLTASVVLDLPLERMREQFGPWARYASAADAAHTRWPFGGDVAQDMAYALLWIPEGVEYELEADADFVAFLREAASRMLGAADRAERAAG